MSAPPADGADLHEIFAVETDEPPVVVALPDPDMVGVEAEVIAAAAGGGGESAEASQPAAAKEEGGRVGITTPSRRGSSSRFLTDVIVEMGLVARERVIDAIAASRSSGTTPERVLVKREPSAPTASPRAGRALRPRLRRPRRFQRGHERRQPRDHRRRQALRGGCRWRSSDERTLLVAMADPANVLRGRRHRDPDRLRGARGGRRARGHRRADLAPGPPRRRRRRHRRARQRRTGGRVVELHETADDAPVVKLVNQLVAQAVEQGASDVHISPDGTGDCACASASTACCSDITTVPRRMGRRGGLAHEDHGRARHLRAAHPPGRPRRADRRRAPRRPARGHAAHRPRRGRS